MLFGLWLFAGLHPKETRLMALASFTSLLGLSLYQALSGEASCGCFGKVPLSPWYTAAFDLMAVAALWTARPVRQPIPGFLSSYPLRFSVFLLLFLVGGIASGVAIVDYTPAHLTPGGEILGESEVVVLKPENWMGQHFGLLKHIDIGDTLARGEWIALLYHRDCVACRAEIAKYEKQVRSSSWRETAARVAFIEVPNRRAAGPALVSADTPCFSGRLSLEKDWFVRTPVLLKIRDGSIVGLDVPSDGKSGGELRSTPPKERIVALPAAREIFDIKAHAGLRTSERQSFPGFPDYRRMRRERFLKEIACGPLSLLAILKHYEVPLTPDETDQILAAAGNKGTDLLQLKELAERHGLHALGVEISAAKLKEIGLPAIVHLDGIAFAALTGVRSDGFELVYPMQAPVSDGQRPVSNLVRPDRPSLVGLGETAGGTEPRLAAWPCAHETPSRVETALVTRARYRWPHPYPRVA